MSVPRLQVRRNLPLRRISLARLVCDRGLTIVVAVFSFHRCCSLKCAHTHTEEAYKEYMRTKYEHECWENQMILLSRKMRAQAQASGQA